MMLYVPGIKAQAEYKTFNSKHLTETPLLDENQEQGTSHEFQEVEDHPATQAKVLVAYFYKLFHSIENAVLSLQAVKLVLVLCHVETIG